MSQITTTGGQLHEWTVRIRFNKYGLGGGFSVLVFLGQVPSDPSQWRTASSFIGAHTAFVHGTTDQDTGSHNQGGISEGFVHLNRAIAKRSGLPSLEPDVVVPYLRNNLEWRIQAANRTAVEFSRLPSLEVTVVETPLSQVPGSVFPIPGDPKYHHEITYGRPGGAHHL